jgi:hypothetical protein
VSTGGNPVSSASAWAMRDDMVVPERTRITGDLIPGVWSIVFIYAFSHPLEQLCAVMNTAA